MIYYFPHSDMYVEFEEASGIHIFNVYNGDGTSSDFHSQAERSSLGEWQLIYVGRLIEIHKQVRAGQREYDPYALFSKYQKELLNEKV